MTDVGDRQRNSPVRGSRSWVERTSGSWKGPVEGEEETRGLGPKGGIGDGACQSRCPPHRLKPAAWGELTGQGCTGWRGDSKESQSSQRPPRHGWLLSQDGSRGAQLEESLSPQIWDGTGWKAPEESVSTGSRQREMGKESKCVSNPEKSAVENAPRRGPSSLTPAPNEAPPPPASCRAVRSATRRPLPGAPVPDLGLDESPARYFPLQAFGLPGPRSTQPQN